MSRVNYSWTIKEIKEVLDKYNRRVPSKQVVKEHPALKNVNSLSKFVSRWRKAGVIPVIYKYRGYGNNE